MSPDRGLAGVAAVIGAVGLIFLLRRGKSYDLGEGVFGPPDPGVDTGSLDPDFVQWDTLFKIYGAQYKVPWRWMKAIAMQESQLGQYPSVARGLASPSDVEGSVSQDGLSWGLMQVTLKTARALEGLAIQAPFLNDPNNSVRLAAKLLRQLIDTFGMDDRESVVRAYNGGPHFGSATLAYYTQFEKHIAMVLSSQPGDEREFS